MLADWGTGFDNSDGQWCTLQCADAIYSAFIAAGYSEEEANKYANQILPNAIPKTTELDEDDLEEKGYSSITKYYQDEEEKDKMWVETKTLTPTEESTTYPSKNDSNNNGDSSKKLEK